MKIEIANEIIHELTMEERKKMLDRSVELRGQEAVDELLRNNTSLLDDEYERLSLKWEKMILPMTDIKGIDFKNLFESGLLHPKNKKLRKAFSKIQKVNLPSGVGATNDFIYGLIS